MKSETVLKLWLCVLALALCARAQTTTALMPVIHQQFLDANGTPLAGGFVYSYAAGTSNLHATYEDSLGLSQNFNPIVLDSGGYADIWLDRTAYKICVFNASMIQQYCKDQIQATPQTSSALFAALGSGNTFLGIQVIGSQGTATNTNNFNSYGLKIRASYWNGNVPAAQNDDYQLQDVCASGSNPSCIATWSHTGTTGGDGMALPKLASGIPNNGSGFQHVRKTTGCTTGAPGTGCITTVTWPTAFVDTNYTATCVPLGFTGSAGGFLAYQGISAKSASSVNVNVANAGSGGTATVNGFDCIAVHD